MDAPDPVPIGGYDIEAYMIAVEAMQMWRACALIARVLVQRIIEAQR